MRQGSDCTIGTPSESDLPSQPDLLAKEGISVEVVNPLRSIRPLDIDPSEPVRNEDAYL